MLAHCHPIIEGSIFVFSKPLHNTYDLAIVSKMVTTPVEFEFQKQEEFKRQVREISKQLKALVGYLTPCDMSSVNGRFVQEQELINL